MSRLKYDYSKDHHAVETLGGLEALEAVKEQVATLDLPPCPFCGGEAVVGLWSSYGQPAAAVECAHCHSRTVTGGASYNYLTERQSTLEDAINTAAQRWSMRRATA